MDGAADRPGQLIRVAVASRTAGDGDVAQAAYARAYEAAREADDVEAMTEAALGLAAGQTFGMVPGRVPAYLHEAYRRAGGELRARIAVALGRAWVYGGQPHRAVGFAGEAIEVAERTGNATLLAAALDVQLLVHWGPDDLADRLRVTSRLEDTVAHLTDVEARMSAHLWRLTTAMECLDLASTRRQVRALDGLAEESGSPRVRFFAAARRGAYALITGDLAAAARARDAAVSAGHEAGEADTVAIDRLLSAGIARLAGDRAALAEEAALHEGFGISEGVVSLAAQGAQLWLAAGRPDRAVPLLHQLAGNDFGDVARDVDWLLTLTSLTEVAAATGAAELCEVAAELLAPYAGRGVADAGAGFAGVVDDYLFRALLCLGRIKAAEARRAAAEAGYRRMGATWWLTRVTGGVVAAPRRADVVHLHPSGDGQWTVGSHGATHAVPALRGLQYLRLLLERPGIGVPALDLSDAVAGHPGVQVREGHTGPVVDRQALLAYRRRLAELDEGLARADTRGDAVRARLLEGEREALLAQVAEATGLAGRPRATSSAAERARVAVRKSIATAVARIEAVDPGVARLLRDTVVTGTACRYDPDPGRPVRWVLSEPACTPPTGP